MTFLTRIGRVWPEQEIAFAQAHAAAVREQVADGHLVGDVWVVHDEAGETLVDGIVPGELTFIDQRGERGSRECFRVRADAEHGEFIDGGRIAQFADAVAFGDEDLAVFHDGNGHAGDVESLHRGNDVGVEIGGGSVGGGRLCPCRQDKRGDNEQSRGPF